MKTARIADAPRGYDCKHEARTCTNELFYRNGKPEPIAPPEAYYVAEVIERYLTDARASAHDIRISARAAVDMIREAVEAQQVGVLPPSTAFETLMQEVEAIVAAIHQIAPRATPASPGDAAGP